MNGLLKTARHDGAGGVGVAAAAEAGGEAIDVQAPLAAERELGPVPFELLEQHRHDDPVDRQQIIDDVGRVLELRLAAQHLLARQADPGEPAAFFLPEVGQGDAAQAHQRRGVPLVDLRVHLRRIDAGRQHLRGRLVAARRGLGEAEVSRVGHHGHVGGLRRAPVDLPSHRLDDLEHQFAGGAGIRVDDVHLPERLDDVVMVDADRRGA